MLPHDVAGWVARYGQKTHDPFKLLPGYNLWATHEDGFIMWKVDGEVLWLNQCCGISKVWQPRVMKLAAEHGCKTVMAPTFHNEKTFQRLFGGKFIRDYEDGGHIYHVFALEVDGK